MRFGFITQREFEEEHQRRLRAEGEADAARLQIAALNSLVQELLDRSMPKPPPPGFGLPGINPAAISSTEIYKIPAVGKRGIRERNAAARDADLRLEEQAQANQQQHRRAILTPEEQRILDAQIPK
jgi:hypothetical protein